MTKGSGKILITAAIAGIFSAAAISTPALADDKAAGAKGKCMGANGCKTKSACKTATSSCAGKNACKGKGYLEMTKAECEKMMAKDKKITFSAS